MSGGHWDYGQFRMQEVLEMVSRDSDVVLRFPQVAGVLHALSTELGNLVHELDYDLSGDSSISDDREWEVQALLKLEEALSADPSVGHGLPLWYSYCEGKGTLGPFSTQVEAWKSLERLGRRRHEPTGYVWPELKESE